MQRRALERRLQAPFLMHAGTFVHASYTSERSAVRAVESLIASGFADIDIGAFVVGGAERGERELQVAHVTAVPLETLLGAAVGAVLGAAVGAAGIFDHTTWFAGAVVGAAFGIVAGWVGGIGLWHKTMAFPPHAFTEGQVIVGVNANEARAHQARELLERAGGKDIAVSTARPVSGVRRDDPSRRFRARAARAARSRGH